MYQLMDIVAQPIKISYTDQESTNKMNTEFTLVISTIKGYASDDTGSYQDSKLIMIQNEKQPC